MLDTLLVTSGETKRHFRFGIAIDQSYPLVAAREAMTPVIAVPTETGPPRSGPTGWFFHQSAKNVQILSVRGTPPPAEPDGEQPFGFVVRLAETEGRPRDVKLQCFRAPASARTQDFQGNAFHTLAIAGDAVSIPMHGYEIIDVELRF
jgi:alpha-mannosidase